MSSLRERPNTALLVVDVQNDVVANAHRRDEVIANINTLIDDARAAAGTRDLGPAHQRPHAGRQRRLAVRARTAA